MSYQGWKNHNTWAVALWIDNEQGTHFHKQALVEDAWLSAEPSEYHDKSNEARHALHDTLKEWVTEEMIPDLGATLASDLLTAAMSEVDWNELADTWLRDTVDDYEPCKFLAHAAYLEQTT